MRTASSGPERLNRFLARRGVASRRGADRLIEEGRVTVNGGPAELGVVVDPARDVVAVDGRDVGAALTRRTLMLNKPPGVVTTRRDPQGRPTVLDLVDDPTGLFPVGRLDAQTRGLLLLTTDGDLAHRLTHPRHQVPRRYVVRVRGSAGRSALRRLTGGVTLEDGPARALEAAVTGATPEGDVLELVMGEGRKREVRRLCAAVGLPVLDLQRVAYGPLRLGRLREGDMRLLTQAEERQLYAGVGLGAGEATGQGEERPA